MKFETLAVSETDGIAHIELNRPEKANALSGLMWKELRAAFDWLDASDARAGVLSARGKHFTAGIDLELLMAVKSDTAAQPKEARQEHLRGIIAGLQNAVSAAESCRKPILAAIHGACLGAGVDLVTACDMRYSTQDARFSVKEVDLGIVADLGTLQRIPRLIGEGLARELAYTGREFDGKEAHAMRLVNQIFPDKDSLIKSVMEIAVCIAQKSPLAIRGIKDTLNYSRDHSVAEGLAFAATRNATILSPSDRTE
jgi:enoyl-CoA hydratase/carnithine racemase